MQTFQFTSDSVIDIKAESSMHPIEGQSQDVSGRVEVEIDDQGQLRVEPRPSAHVELPIEALESGHTLQDKEMRRRVEAKKFPTINYRLEEATGGPEQFKLSGTLTFHGVEQQFSETVTARLDGDSLVVEGEHTFDIRDFDVKPPKMLGLQVYPEVRVVARLVGRPV